MAHKLFEGFEEFVRERALPDEIEDKVLEAGFVEPENMVKDFIKTSADYSKVYYTYPTGRSHKKPLVIIAKKRHDFAGFAFKWKGEKSPSLPLTIFDSPEKVDAILNNLDDIVEGLENGEFDDGGKSPSVKMIADKYLK